MRIGGPGVFALDTGERGGNVAVLAIETDALLFKIPSQPGQPAPIEPARCRPEGDVRFAM